MAEANAQGDLVEGKGIAAVLEVEVVAVDTFRKSGLIAYGPVVVELKRAAAVGAFPRPAPQQVPPP